MVRPGLWPIVAARVTRYAASPPTCARGRCVPRRTRARDLPVAGPGGRGPRRDRSGALVRAGDPHRDRSLTLGPHAPTVVDGPRRKWPDERLDQSFADPWIQDSGSAAPPQLGPDLLAGSVCVVLDKVSRRARRRRPADPRRRARPAPPRRGWPRWSARRRRAGRCARAGGSHRRGSRRRRPRDSPRGPPRPDPPDRRPGGARAGAPGAGDARREPRPSPRRRPAARHPGDAPAPRSVTACATSCAAARSTGRRSLASGSARSRRSPSL